MGTRHPRIEGFERLRRLEGAAAELGYRMPAEWERQSCVWVSWPENEETWPGVLGEARGQWEAWVEAMRQHVPVCTVQGMGIATNDAWVRDYGPVFVVRDEAGAGKASVACHDFHFNGWGGKYELRELDDVVPQRIARALGLPIEVHDFVLEGGAIDVNGAGTVMTTEQCLLNPNRNPGLSREALEQRLHATLGTRHVIWLPGGIAGDDTDGHVDDLARFVGPGAVVAARAEGGHPDHAVLERNWEVLREARDQDGGRLELVELPVPEVMSYDYPADRFGPGGEEPVPASYANFLITNGAVFVPVFGQERDERALRVLEGVFAGREIVPVRSEHLVVGLGAVHCLSMQQPAGKGSAC